MSSIMYVGTRWRVATYGKTVIGFCHTVELFEYVKFYLQINEQNEAHIWICGKVLYSIYLIDDFKTPIIMLFYFNNGENATQTY